MKGRRKAKNIFGDLGFREEEAANLEARSRLMIAIEQEITKKDWSQAEAAKKLGVKPPRISELVHGQIQKFSLDLLVNYLFRLGLGVEFHFIKKAA